MDNKSPNTSIDYGMPQFFTRDTLFINQTTPITIIPRDKHSGVQATTTTVNGEVQAGNEFTIPSEGHKEIVFSSVDMVNNQEKIKLAACMLTLRQKYLSILALTISVQKTTYQFIQTMFGCL